MINKKLENVFVVTFPATAVDGSGYALISVIVGFSESIGSFDDGVKMAKSEAKKIARDNGYYNDAVTFNALAGRYGYDYPMTCIDASDVVIGEVVAPSTRYTVVY